MKYGTRKYNAQRYNIDGLAYARTLVETVTNTDSTQTVGLEKALAESMAFTESLVFSSDQKLSEFLFLDELIQIQVTSKALADIIRLADWLSIERNPPHNGWYD